MKFQDIEVGMELRDRDYPENRHGTVVTKSKSSVRIRFDRFRCYGTTDKVMRSPEQQKTIRYDKAHCQFLEPRLE